MYSVILNTKIVDTYTVYLEDVVQFTLPVNLLMHKNEVTSRIFQKVATYLFYCQIILYLISTEIPDSIKFAPPSICRVKDMLAECRSDTILILKDLSVRIAYSTLYTMVQLRAQRIVVFRRGPKPICWTVRSKH